ncbi:regulator [Virgibacillus sp. 7505]|uniref:RraA family protein n=1 Tax=Virgibacillus sp. 7505 TaxID=2022548 RepID=UPI000BA51802|nr:RraA family protein [Virgibacillus sp. 7505]PAE16753.1 regulator [Virgibacillus sp. 7505]
MFKDIPSTSVSDALQGKNHMSYEIKPIGDFHLSGPAFTVEIDEGENISVLEAMYKAKPGDVLVVDGKGWTENAVAGDFILNLGKTLGLAGIVIDGVIRDIKGSLALDYPIFCKGTTTCASKKTQKGLIGVPIVCGGVTVNPGDYIVGDSDGVVVVPHSEASSIREQALEKISVDEKRENSVGQDVDAARKYIEDFLIKVEKNIVL